MSLFKILDMALYTVGDAAVAHAKLHNHQQGYDSDLGPMWDPSPESASRAPTEVEALRARVAELELVVKVLGDVLVERAMVEPGALAARAQALRERIVSEGAARREEQRTRIEAERRAADEARRARVVECVACNKTLPESESYRSSEGVLCGVCHADREG